MGINDIGGAHAAAAAPSDSLHRSTIP